jgi:hypothetical protein
MRKLLIIFGAVLVASGVVAAGAIACTHNGQGNDGWHGSANGAKLVAYLAPPVASGPTGSTGSTGTTGSTGPTANAGSVAKASHFQKTDVVTGVRGLATASQNSERFKLKIGLAGLTAGAAYSISLLQDADGQGCSSTTNTVLDPPGLHTVTANPNGFARAKLVTKTTDFALDLTKSYYVKVSDSTGATAACGVLTPWSHHGFGSGYHHQHH